MHCQAIIIHAMPPCNHALSTFLVSSWRRFYATKEDWRWNVDGSQLRNLTTSPRMGRLISVGWQLALLPLCCWSLCHLGTWRGVYDGVSSIGLKDRRMYLDYCPWWLHGLNHSYTVEWENLVSIKFGKLALSRYWWIFNLAIWILSAIGMHAIIHIGEFLIWRSLPNLSNRQIKYLAKVFRYTVYWTSPLTLASSRLSSLW